MISEIEAKVVPHILFLQPYDRVLKIVSPFSEREVFRNDDFTIVIDSSPSLIGEEEQEQAIISGEKIKFYRWHGTSMFGEPVIIFRKQIFCNNKYGIHYVVSDGYWPDGAKVVGKTGMLYKNGDYTVLCGKDMVTVSNGEDKRKYSARKFAEILFSQVVSKGAETMSRWSIVRGNYVYFYRVIPLIVPFIIRDFKPVFPFDKIPNNPIFNPRLRAIKSNYLLAQDMDTGEYYIYAPGTPIV